MYYNQNSYAHIPYPAPGYQNATVKSGGCGVCCASMVVEGLCGVSFGPEKSAALAIQSGARVSGGTDMKALAAAMAASFGITWHTSSDISALAAHLKAGGWAIANVGGDRSGYTGLFSSAGHYIVARGISDKVIIWDPGYYSGKFDKAGRKGKVTVSGSDILVQPGLLDTDCQSRSPRYYLFSGEVKSVDNTPSTWAKDAWEKCRAAGVLDGTYPKQPLTREQLALVLVRLGLVKD